MGIKKLEDFNHEVEVTKQVLSSMPINNEKNLTAYKKKVSELKTEYSGYKDQLYAELKKRTNSYLSKKDNERLALVKKELLDYEDIGLFNPINTPFQKMGFDTLLYSLTHYYKNNLVEVNADIKEVFDKFELVGIHLTEDDFVYSNYARKYIREWLKDDNIDKMKDVFEDLHWKCPDVISHIETSFRILFDKNIKAFEKYIEERKKEVILDNLTYDDYVIKKNSLGKELFELENYDSGIIVKKFMDGQLLLNDYTVVNVNRCYSKFLGDNCDVQKGKEKIGDFKTLYHSLVEHKGFLRYSYVLDDVKKKYADKEKHRGETEKITKEINALIADLTRLTEEINSGSTKGFLFLKKKVDIEKNYLEVNEKVKELDIKYEEYDREYVLERMNYSLSDTSSIYDVFKFVLSFKGYLRECIKAQEEDIEIHKVKKIVREFENFLDDPDINMLKNINFNNGTDVAMVLIDHFKLLNINVNGDDLTLESIDTLINNLIIIINDYYLSDAGMDINYINDLFEAKKLVDEN